MDCGDFAVNRILLKRASRKWRKGVPYQELSGLNLKDTEEQYDGRNMDGLECNQEEEEREEIRFSRSSGDSRANVTVVVGKERRVFKMDPHILEDELFWSLREKEKDKAREDFGDIIFLEHCDSILSEHMLWLVCNDDPSLLRLIWRSQSNSMPKTAHDKIYIY